MPGHCFATWPADFHLVINCLHASLPCPVPKLHGSLSKSSLATVGHQNFSMYSMTNRVPSAWLT